MIYEKDIINDFVIMQKNIMRFYVLKRWTLIFAPPGEQGRIIRKLHIIGCGSLPGSLRWQGEGSLHGRKVNSLSASTPPPPIAPL